MPFPTVVNSATTTGAGSSVALNMPASIVAGRLLLALCGIDGTRDTTAAMSGWTTIGRTAGGASTLATTIAVFAKIAAGGDSGSVAPGATEDVAAIVYQVDEWSGLVADIKYAGSTSSTGQGDPPSLTVPSAADYLWFGAVSLAAGVPATTAPTNYAGLLSAATGTVTGAGIIHAAYRALNASVEDPGAFGGGSSPTGPIPATITVKGATAGPPPGQFFPFLG